MHSTASKERFHCAYIHALAAQAGLNHGEFVVDDDSIDVMIKGKGFTGKKLRDPQIHLQLKCTAQDVQTLSTLSFPLKRKNYDDLRGVDVVCPRYLAILLVPAETQAWIEHNESGMLLRHVCYWISIRDYPPIVSQSATVKIPIAQRLTTSELLRLITLASEGLSA